MGKKEFVEAVEAQAKREGLPGSIAISPGFTPICGDCRDRYDLCCEYSARAAWESGDVIEEGDFSWSSCDLCGSSLGGDRHAAHFFIDDDPQRETIHLEVCVDCLLYLANGDVPENWGE